MMKIGTMSMLHETTDMATLYARIVDSNLKYTQTQCWNPDLYTDENAAGIRNRLAATGVTITALWAGYSGRVDWDFRQGPVNMGLVPAWERRQRLDDLKKGADFAVKIGAPAIITHCGFLPENMTDGEYVPVRAAITEIAQYCKDKGIGFWFETGQESPVTLLRFIEDIGLDNLGINLDPANLILYGKGAPLDALDVFGKYVRNIHVKDGLPPTDGFHLGKEVQVGQGNVHYPEFVKKLLNIGFDGEWIIEREIGENDEQLKQIAETVENLKKWAGEA